ncbi:MAG: extracellular solute-binding protein [Clostridia bacterium]|nr:extracellular solute-binding protein [Clostridia bacterium]
MKIKKLNLLLAVLLVVSLVIGAAGCTNKKDAGSESQANTVEASATAKADDKAAEQKKEIVFPDSLPKNPKPVDKNSYGYDDLSKAYKIEIMLSGHKNQPISDDKIKQYLDKKYNTNLTFTNIPGDQFINNAMVRFSSGDEPDFMVVKYEHSEAAFNLFKQGKIADATPILQYMPQAVTYVTKDYKNWATVDGKMAGVPRYNTFMDNWGLFVRADWLKEFGMSVPTTEDELFAYAKAIVEKDPNKNNKKDEYLAITAAGGINFFMLDPLRAMYGHVGGSEDSGINVVDGKINHPMLDGTIKRYVEFVKKLYDNKMLAPDWFTMNWDQMKALRNNDQLGMVFYPGKNLVEEDYDAKKKDKSALERWVPLPPLKSNDGKGGKMFAAGLPGGMFVFSEKAAKDEGKIKRIAHLVDTMIYPNENYWACSQGGGPEIFPEMSTVKFNDDGTNIFNIVREKHPAETDQGLAALADWQWIGYTLQYQVYDTPEGLVGSKFDMEVNSAPRYQNYEMKLKLDAANLKAVKEFQIKKQLEFILGKRSMDQWDKYVEEWKNAGGQKMLDEAAEQLKVSK